MKRIVPFIILIFILILSAEICAQDNSAIFQTFYSDSLKTGTRDSIKTTPSSIAGIECWQVSAYSTTADTMVILVQSVQDATVFVQRGVINLASGLFETQMVTSATRKDWLVAGSPQVASFLFFSGDTTKLIFFTIAGRKSIPIY